VTHSPALLDASSQAIAFDRGRVRAAGPTGAVLKFIAERSRGDQTATDNQRQPKAVGEDPA